MVEDSGLLFGKILVVTVVSFSIIFSSSPVQPLSRSRLFLFSRPLFRSLYVDFSIPLLVCYLLSPSPKFLFCPSISLDLFTSPKNFPFSCRSIVFSLLFPRLPSQNFAVFRLNFRLNLFQFLPLSLLSRFQSSLHSLLVPRLSSSRSLILSHSLPFPASFLRFLLPIYFRSPPSLHSFILRHFLSRKFLLPDFSFPYFQHSHHLPPNLFTFRTPLSSFLRFPLSFLS